MKFGEMLAEEREFILRSLAFCGIRVVVNLSTIQGRFKLSENELADQDIQEIHLLDESYEGIRIKLEEMGFIKKGMIGKWSIYVKPEEILNSNEFPGIYKVGHMIILNRTIGSTKSGTKAMIYRLDLETRNCSIITEKGTTIGSFNEHQQLHDFIFLKDCFVKYEYINYETLLIDFANGIFKPLFQ